MGISRRLLNKNSAKRFGIGGTGLSSKLAKWLTWDSNNDETEVVDTSEMAASFVDTKCHVRFLGSNKYVRVWKRITDDYIVAQIYDMSAPSSPVLGTLKVIYSATDDIHDVKVIGTGFAVITRKSAPEITACTVSGTTITIGASVATTMSAGTFGSVQGNSTKSTIIMVQRTTTVLEMQYATISGTVVTMQTMHNVETGLASATGEVLLGVVADGRLAVISSDADTFEGGVSLFGFDEAGVTNGTSEIAQALLFNPASASSTVMVNYWVGKEVSVYFNGAIDATIWFTYRYITAAGVNKQMIDKFKYRVGTDDFALGATVSSIRGICLSTAQGSILRRLSNTQFTLQRDVSLTSTYNIIVGYLAQEPGADIASMITPLAGNDEAYPATASGAGENVSIDIDTNLNVGFLAGNFPTDKGMYKGIKP